MHIARRETSGPFTDADAAMLARVTTRSQTRSAARCASTPRAAQHPDAPGLMVLGASNEVELVTPQAHPLLAAMRSGATADVEDTPPRRCSGWRNSCAAIAATAALIRQVTVPSRVGWLALHASLPDGPRSGRVAIVIEPAAGPQSATLRLEVNGVTSREREVATLLARGFSNAEIADTLVLSAHTVGDHIKSIYDKLGVGSRQELVARGFLDEYMPEVAVQTPITSKGRFVAGDPAPHGNVSHRPDAIGFG